jgi:hypothetical protein
MLLIPPNYQNGSVARLSLHNDSVRQAWFLALKMRDVGVILSLSEGTVSFATPSIQFYLNISSKQLIELKRPFTDIIHPNDLRVFQSVRVVTLHRSIRLTFASR